MISFFARRVKAFSSFRSLRLLDRKPFRKAKLPTSSGLLRCVTDSYRLEIYNFTGSLNCSRALSAGPGSAFGVAKSIEHTTVEAAQDVAHQVECSFIDEIGTMYRRAINFAREKARAIETSQTLSVGEDGSARGGRFESPMRLRRRMPKCLSRAEAPRTESRPL
jgi:hypothetical protein